jgi:hypothetical protein
MESIERQEKALKDARAWCEGKGIPLDTTLTITDLATSAFRGKNSTEGNLSLFIKAVEEGRISKGSFLIVEELSRFSRDRVMKATELFLRLLNHGIKIVSLVDKTVFETTDNPTTDMTQLIISTTLLTKGHHESFVKQDYQLKKHDRNRTEAREGKKIAQYNLPSWIKKTKSGGETCFEIIPERGKVIQKIFELARTGLGATKIVQTLNDDKTPLWGNRENGIRFVLRLLKNRAVIGEFQPQILKDGERFDTGEPIPGYYPPVISTQLFDEVQVVAGYRRKNRKFSSSTKNMLGAAMRCYKCGKLMRVDSYPSQGKEKKVRAIGRCLGRLENTCDSLPIKYDSFERAVLFHLTGIDVSSIIGDGKSGRIEDLSLQKEIHLSSIKSLQEEIEALQDLEVKAAVQKQQEDSARYTKAIHAKQVKIAETNEAIGKVETELSSLQTISGTEELKTIQELSALIYDSEDLEKAEETRKRIKLSILHIVESIVCYPHKGFHKIKGSPVLTFHIQFKSGVSYSVCSLVEDPSKWLRIELDRPLTEEEKELYHTILMGADPISKRLPDKIEVSETIYAALEKQVR